MMGRDTILWIIFQLWIATVSGKKLLTLPSLMEADTTTHVCLLLQDLDRDEEWTDQPRQNNTYTINVTINYIDINQAEQHVFVTPSLDYHSCFTISTPDEAGQITTEVSVSISYQTTKGDNLSWNIISYRSNITSRVTPLITLIHTDKPIYKPGQTVKFRVMTMDYHLYPRTYGYVLIKIESPNGVRMKQWKNIKVTSGLVSLEMPLSIDPVLGEWKITTTHGHTSTEKVFTVDEYVLPKFEVTVKPPPYLLPTSKNISGTVCAMYTYGKPVEGEIKLKLCYMSRYGLAPRPCAIIKEKIFGRCFEFTMDADKLELKSRNYSQYGHLVITANVTEEQTGIMVSALSTGPSMTMTPLFIEIKDDSNSQFKPGFPYKARVIVTNPDGTPAPEENIKISAESARTGYRWKNIRTTDIDGLIHFSIHDIVKGAMAIELKAERVDDDSDKIFSSNKNNHILEQVKGDHVITEWHSPSDSFIYIPDTHDATECETTVALDVYYTAEPGKDYTFMSMIRAGDNVVSSGVTEIKAQDVAFVSDIPSNDKFDKLTRGGKEEVKRSIRKRSLKPKFLPTLEKITVHKGDTAILKCHIRNLGLRTFLWRKEGAHALMVIGGQMFVPDENMTTELLINSETDAVSKLTIKDSNPIHSGTYVCQISPGTERYSYHVKLEVIEHEPPTNITVFEDGFVSLPCSVKNIPEGQPLFVAWFDELGTMISLGNQPMIDDPRFGVDRPADNQWNFIIRNVKPKDSGLYICKADTKPIQSKAVKLDVITLNMIMTGDKYVVKGDDIVINCTLPPIPESISEPISDLAQVNISWFIDERKIKASHKRKTIVKKIVGETLLSQLTVERSRLKDSGKYICRNSHFLVGSIDVKVVRAEDKPIEIPIKEVDPMFLPTPKNITIHRGESAVFKCHIKNIGNKTAAWKMPLAMAGDMYVSNKQIEVDVNDNETDSVSIMTIRDTKPIYSGTYTCYITRASKLYAYHFNLQVLEFESPEKVVFVKGAVAVLPCLKGIPQEHEVVWTNENHTLLTQGEKRIIDDSRFSVQQTYAAEEWNLLIQKVGPKDSGTYICQVNTNPVTAKAVILDVKVLGTDFRWRIPTPMFLPTPKNITVHQGETAVLKCHIRNLGAKTVIWRIEGTGVPIAVGEALFVPDEHLAIELLTKSETDVLYTLTLKDSQPNHSGTYNCQSSGTKTYTYSINLNVLEPETPENVTVVEGENAHLPCSFKGIDGQRVIWLDVSQKALTYGDTRIIDDPRFSVERPSDDMWNLLIRDVQQEYSGKYTCQANTRPVKEKTVELNVLQRPNKPIRAREPMFMPMPNNITVHEGETAVLKCHVRNLGPKMVVWKMEGTNVPIAVGEELFLSDKHLATELSKTSETDVLYTLTLGDSQPNQSGTYVCQITAAQLYTYSITLNILGKPSKARETMFLPTPKNITVHEGETAVLECHIRNLGAKTIIWRMEGTYAPIAVGGNLFVPDEQLAVELLIKSETDVVSSLIVKESRPNQSGRYICQMSDTQLYTYSITLNVLDKPIRTIQPMFLPTPKNVTVHEGETAVLKCHIRNLGTKAVVWGMTDTETPIAIGTLAFVPNEHLTMELSATSETDVLYTLTLKDSQPNQSGTYICQITAAQLFTYPITLNILDTPTRAREPMFMPMPNNITVHEGETAVLKCHIRNLGPKMVIWKMEGTNVPIAVGEDMFLSDKHLATELSKKSETDVLYTLTLKDSQPNQSGTFICQITAAQLYTYPITLNILGKPNKARETMFLPTPKNITVHEGETAVLECHIRNLGAKTIIWRMEGTYAPIAVGANLFVPDEQLAVELLMKAGTDVVSSLIVKESQPNQSGRYICQISDTQLYIYSITLNVLEKPIRTIEPMFLPTPKNVTVHEGETAVLKCHVRNLGTKTVVWRMTDTETPIAIGTLAFVPNEHLAIELSATSETDVLYTLTLKDSQPNQSGTYICQITTAQLYTYPITLNILDKPTKAREPMFMPMPNNITVHQGETAVLKCHVRNLGPKMVIWKMEGTNEPVAIGEELFLSDKHLATELSKTSETDVLYLLTLKDSQPNQSGTYVCQITGAQLYTYPITLNILGKPNKARETMFLPTPKNITVHEGETAVLKCHIRNLGAKTIIWRMEGTYAPIAVGANLFVPDEQLAMELLIKSETDVVSSLIVKESQPNQSGRYICQISDTQLYTYSITLNVLELPERITVVEGQSVTLLCSFSGIDGHTVRWLDVNKNALTYGDRRIIDDPRFSVERPNDEQWNLLIRDVQLEYSGKYTCQANTNPIKERTVELHVLPAPNQNVQRLAHFKLEIPVQKAYSPNAKLLLMYMREDGEVVASTLQFNVKGCFGNKASLSFAKTTVKPGTTVNYTVSASKGSTCFVGMVDKSVMLLGGNNQITPKDVFERVGRVARKHYFVSYYEQDRAYCRRKHNGTSESDRSPSEYRPIGKDSMTAFRLNNQLFLQLKQHINVSLDRGRGPAFDKYVDFSPYVEELPAPCGMEVTIAVVSDGQIQTRTCVNSRKQSTFVWEKGEPVNIDTRSEEVDNIRSFFPETWLWDIVIFGNNQKTLTVPTTIPDTITEWVGNTVCTSPDDGVGVSEVTGVTAFQPFFVSLTLPYSAIRGEKLPVVVTVFNYLSECVPMEIRLSEMEGFHVDGGHRKQFCLCGGKSISSMFYITPTLVGEIDIEVVAVSINNKRACAGVKIGNLTAGVSDGVQRQLLIEAEGVQEELTWSSYICVNDKDVESRTVEWNLPDDIVPDSYRAVVSVVGDLMGPTLQNLKNLLRMPYGCGEQNMASWAPNIYVLQYLTYTEQLTPEIEKEAKNYMTFGYQRQMNYRHVDNSYSAWGENRYNNATGSLWLTIFVVKSMAKSSDIINVDVKDISKSVTWIVDNQDEDGCFPPYGKVFSSYMKGGLADGDNLAGLTAFALIALLETDLGDEFTPHINKGFVCLDTYDVTMKDTYTLSVMLYAYTLWNKASRRRYEVMTEVERRKVSSYGMVHWKREETEEPADDTKSWYRASSAEVEMTAYNLLSVLIGDSDAANGDAHSIVQWLTKQRNPHGGFSSTQDTVVALQALAKFGQLTCSGKTDVVVEVKNSVSNSKFFISRDNSLVTQSEEVSRDDNKVEVTATGSGCVLAQVTMKYNVYKHEVPGPAFEVKVDVHRSKVDSMNCAWRSLSVCARYLKSVVSNMAIAEIKMPTGWVPVKSSVQELVKTNKVQRMDLDKNYVQLYFDELTNVATCVSFEVEQDIVMDPKPALVKVYDYYETSYEVTTQYEITTLKNCGTKQEIPLDNRGLDCDVEQCRDEIPFPIEMTCPACPSEKIENDALIKLTCNLTAVYKVMAGKKGLYSMKVKANLREKKKKTLTDVYVNYMMLDDCSCPIIEGPETRVLIFTDTSSLNSEMELIFLKESDTVMSYDASSVKLIRKLASRPKLCTKIERLQRKGTKRSLSKLESLKKRLGL